MEKILADPMVHDRIAAHTWWHTIDVAPDTPRLLQMSAIGQV